MMTLDTLFLQILNMTITGTYVILAILLVRLVMRKAPKVFSYALWSAAAFRLLYPISFPSILSLFSFKPFNMTAVQTDAGQALVYVPSNIGLMQKPQIGSGIETADRIINGALPAANATTSVNPIQIWTAIASGIWLAGLLGLLAYGVVSYIKVRHLVSNAVRLEGNVYEADHIPTPFVLGFLKPQIYLPFRMPESERAYILRHERHHIRRGDHLIKPLSFLLLTVHWFNPLVWVAYYLMVRDMEMSCDESVLRQMGLSLKHNYSESLLALAIHQHFPTASPLAFGESNARLRVRNVLHFRRPKTWIMATSLLLSLVVLLACAANPQMPGSGTSQSGTTSGPTASSGTALSSTDIQALKKYDPKLAVNSLVVKIKERGLFEQFIERLDLALDQKLATELPETMDQMRQWGLTPETPVRALIPIAQTYLDRTNDGIQIGTPEFNQLVAFSLSDSSGMTGQARANSELGPIYLFMCIYQDYGEKQTAGSSKYPFSEAYNAKTLEEICRDDIVRDFGNTDSINVLKSFAAEMNLKTDSPLPVNSTEVELASGFIMDMLDIPNGKIKTALDGMNPANQAVNDAALESAIATLSGDRLAESLLASAGTSFRNQFIDFHYQAIIKGFTINANSVKVIPSATQKSLYSFEATALFNDGKESKKSLMLIGRIQFDDSGKINFVSLEGSDYYAIWAQYAPRQADIPVGDYKFKDVVYVGGISSATRDALVQQKVETTYQIGKDFLNL